MKMDVSKCFVCGHIIWYDSRFYMPMHCDKCNRVLEAIDTWGNNEESMRLIGVCEVDGNEILEHICLYSDRLFLGER